MSKAIRVFTGFFSVIFGVLVVGPIQSIRIMRRGAQAVAVFRQQHGREPTEAEWEAISDRVGREMLG